jgi:hypothetical protein
VCAPKQVRSAAEEYHAEFAAKEATIASLTAEAEGARAHMQAEIDRLRADMEARTHWIHPPFTPAVLRLPIRPHRPCSPESRLANCSVVVG